MVYADDIIVSQKSISVSFLQQVNERAAFDLSTNIPFKIYIGYADYWIKKNALCCSINSDIVNLHSIAILGATGITAIYFLITPEVYCPLMEHLGTKCVDVCSAMGTPRY
jgi:hypothetical protein